MSDFFKALSLFVTTFTISCVGMWLIWKHATLNGYSSVSFVICVAAALVSFVGILCVLEP